jgi:Swi5
MVHDIALLTRCFRNGEDAQKIVSRHIKLLHRYNEAKDAAQVILQCMAKE